MSCQSLAARAFAEPDKDGITHCSGGFHRSVRFSSDSRGSTRASSDADSKRDTPGSMSLTALTMTPVTSQSSAMSQSAPPSSTTFDLDQTSSPPPSACRFPKLEECAHFHYERVSLGGIRVELLPSEPEDELLEGWVSLRVQSHVASPLPGAALAWTLVRSADHFRNLDLMLHRCIYDRKVSGLPVLTPEASRHLLADYVHHLSIIADDSLNCGPVLSWLQMDNRGHKLLVANEDSSSINTPAVAAAYSVRKYESQARDEISFDVGDMISIIDMPGPQESQWWRGKRGFRVGFFPHHCVAVIGDKVPRHMTQPPPIVGSVAVAPIKPVLRKHGKLISLFRSFILSRPSRRSLKQQGILRERVFGCDLGEHLLNCGQDGDSVPLVLSACAAAIEARGAVDGVYRLSGGSGLTQRLRAAFDAGAAPDLQAPALLRDPHAVPSLLKMYFRELPNPLCTYQLYGAFVSAVQAPDEASKLRAVREAVVKLPPPHYRTLAYLMRHLRRVSLLGELTGMTARNMAIVWAPNLLRSPRPQHALQGVAVQAVVTEFLICYAEDLFAQEQDTDSGPDSLEQDRGESELELRGAHNDSGRRPKSLPLHPVTKLLSLEEARRRGASQSCSAPAAPAAPSTPGAIAAPSTPGAIAVAAQTQLRPSGHLRPKYIEVGSGPNNLPQYHTVLDLPLQGGAKRSLKRSPAGWRGLFSRSKQRARAPPPAPSAPRPPPHTDLPLAAPPVRPVKSCESLSSEADTLPPLLERGKQHKHHTRSSSCDSYFEPWQAELADMRLRLAPQERDHHMFSEEGDADPPCTSAQGDSAGSSPSGSGLSSVQASPRRAESVVALEERLAHIGYIDGDSPRGPKHPRPPSPPARADSTKRVCKDRESPPSAQTEFHLPPAVVKLRERTSPRKTRCSARYSGMHHPVIDDKSTTSRLSWHGKDGHSTLIRIDWPIDNSSISNLTASTINSSPLTPVTPVYDPLESDSEVSEANKHTIQIKTEDCNSCDAEKCLKCELKATDYENIKDFSEPNLHDSQEPSPVHSTDISYHNLNRLSAVSTSSNSDHNSDKKNSDVMKIMTSSHESSSTYSNVSLKQDELYECYNFTRPTYINLSSSTSKSSPGSPLKSPLKSTISITFRTPSKVEDNVFIDNIDTPTNNDRDSVYEDIDLDKNLSIVEDATIPQTDASLPTQQACQPEFDQDLIILETPTDNTDVYSQVKFFKQSIEEVNAMLLETPEKEEHYENVSFQHTNDYENIDQDALKICEKDLVIHNNIVIDDKSTVLAEKENGNLVKRNSNVRELAIRFESPTEQKAAFTFEKFKADVKYPTLERNEVKVERKEVKLPPPVSPKTYKLSKNSCNARSLDENAFVKEFGSDKSYVDRRKSLEVREHTKTKNPPDMNLNTDNNEPKGDITPVTENKICLIQRFDRPTELKSLISFDTEKKLSRERIEKYKEERRNFLREKYSSQSFRSNPEQLTRIKIKKDQEDKIETCERLREELPKFERRNTVDLGQRMRFSLARSTNNLDTIPSPTSPVKEECSRRGEGSDRTRNYERKEKLSPSYNIRDMAAMFEQKSHNSG